VAPFACYTRRSRLLARVGDTGSLSSAIALARSRRSAIRYKLKDSVITTGSIFGRRRDLLTMP
jgi:hypothetical protein